MSDENVRPQDVPEGAVTRENLVGPEDVDDVNDDDGDDDDDDEEEQGA